jgi:diadenylate cyclase
VTLTGLMKIQKLTGDTLTLVEAGIKMAESLHVDAVMILLENPLDWQRVKQLAGDVKLILVADNPEKIAGIEGSGLLTIELAMRGSPVYDKLTQALVDAIAGDMIPSKGTVVAIYSAFEANSFDTISMMDLGDHLGRLTVRDLRRIETSVPLDTLKSIVDLALEIGHEGWEGKPVGTLFVVGDTRAVLDCCRGIGFDPVKGYRRKERNLKERRVREAVKEIAVIDGAFVVSPDGTIEASAQYIDAPANEITLPKGFGARHWAAAAISKATNAIAVSVSESSGSVRLFQAGKIKLRLEPFRRPMKWKDSEYEPPAAVE